MNGQLPTASLSSWIHDQQSKEVPDRPNRTVDMYVFGFQEVDMSTEAFMYGTPAAKEEAWFSALSRGLGEGYVKVRISNLTEITIISVHTHSNRYLPRTSSEWS